MAMDDLRRDAASATKTEAGNALIGVDNDNDRSDELCEWAEIASSLRVEVGREVGHPALPVSFQSRTG